MTTWTEQQRDIALKAARAWAKQGNEYMAHAMLNRAARFDYVSRRRRNNVLRLLQETN